MKILAVDDDPIFLDVLREALRAAGYTDLTTVLSPQDALYTLERQGEAFDCILLDIQMPVMNGVDLCARVRKLAQYRRTPILMITSMSTRNYIDDAFAAGATDYITKPLDPTEFRARIGMVERLVHEQLRAALLEHQIGLASGMVELQFDLETPVMIPGFDRGIEYLALQNYMLTLGIKGSYAVSAFAITIRNAGVIYRKSTPLSFMNMLADVASIIEDTLKTEQALIAYAGNGVFVVASNGLSGIDCEELEAEINLGIESFESIYLADRLPVPQVRVGEVVRNSIFSRERSARILERAISAAQDKPEAKTRKPLAAA